MIFEVSTLKVDFLFFSSSMSYNVSFLTFRYQRAGSEMLDVKRVGQILTWYQSRPGEQEGHGHDNVDTRWSRQRQQCW